MDSVRIDGVICDVVCDPQLNNPISVTDGRRPGIFVEPATDLPWLDENGRAIY